MICLLGWTARDASKWKYVKEDLMLRWIMTNGNEEWACFTGSRLEFIA